ncbi:hypothetical protein EVAR_28826_1 [Eumeta japonica]|uniref:Uncharacterized protein n=1 Tax=Eumeta variegata TaxID=151549 RepID=A0A4C1WKI9_EUMVA|nr:hypothetical protein EVAR_28826_1 [Eumeta japonica]
MKPQPGVSQDAFRREPGRAVSCNNGAVKCRRRLRPPAVWKLKSHLADVSSATGKKNMWESTGSEGLHPGRVQIF